MCTSNVTYYKGISYFRHTMPAKKKLPHCLASMEFHCLNNWQSNKQGKLSNVLSLLYVGMNPIRRIDVEEERLNHLYYQWVNLVLFLQACSFYIPRILWRNLEGKTIQSLAQDLSNPVLNEKKREEQIHAVVCYLTISKVKFLSYLCKNKWRLFAHMVRLYYTMMDKMVAV